jgi:glycosyltransferase involved in cell wall biosynthesis
MKTKSRLLIFSVAYFPFVGGAEVAIKQIADRISDWEFDLVTVNLDGKQPKVEKIGNVTVYRIGSGTWGKYLFPFLGAWKGGQLHRARPYQAIWSMMANYAGFAALFFKRTHPQVPYLLTLQEGDPIDYIKRRVRYVYFWFKQIFAKADYVQAISYYLGDFAKSMGYEGKISVIPNGVDLKLFGAPIDEAEGQKLKQQLDWRENNVYLITTSRLVIKNGIADVIEALPLLPEKTHFLIIGSGPEEMNLRMLTEELKVAERVHFLGQQTYESLPNYLHLAQIFIRPSLSEGMGNSFIEAMAAGLPVIATPVGGIVDFLHDQETGWVCGVQDPESLARQINHILDPNKQIEVAQIVDRARNLAFKNYSWDKVAGEMKEVFNQLIR